MTKANKKKGTSASRNTKRKKGAPQGPRTSLPEKVISPSSQPKARSKTASSPKKGVSIIPVDPLLQAYMREVERHPLLTRDEEFRLAVKYYESKDRRAYQQLVTSNLRFVVKIAYEYVHYRLKLLDLVQEGNMGLLKAVHDFDPYRGVRLTTYAVWWIRSFIQDAIMKNHSLVKIGTTQAQKKLFYRLKREQQRLSQEGFGSEQRVKLLASKFDVREKDVREMTKRMSAQDVSLNAPTPLDENQQHMERLADDKETVIDTLGEAEQRARFSKILREFGETLEGRERTVFSERLVAEKPLTLQELGDRYGVSKERARQIEEQIKNRLRTYVEENYPDYKLLTE